MPVYNRAATVRRAIYSVLAQDFADFELVVVDDGSSDGTVQAVEPIDDRRLTLIPLGTNLGGNAARNRGIAATTAPLIAFLDSDDAYLPHKLRVVVEMFRDRPDLEVLVDSFTLVYPPGSGRPSKVRRNPIIDSNEAFVTALFARRLWKATPAISLRRDAALRVGGFDESLRRRQDFDFLIRLARLARCASTDQLLWTKTWSEGAISAKPDSFVDATIELCRQHPEYLASPSYREGLARDVARHFLRLASPRRWMLALRDARRLSGEFGWSRLLALVVEGLRQRKARRSPGGH